MPTVHYVKRRLFRRHGLAPPGVTITNRPTAVDTKKADTTTQSTATTAVGPRSIHASSPPYIKAIVNRGFLRQHGIAPSSVTITKRSTAVRASLLPQQADAKEDTSATHQTAIKAVGPRAIHAASGPYINAIDGTTTPRAHTCQPPSQPASKPLPLLPSDLCRRSLC